ncbi:MAG: hypothetical protein JWM14_2787 [Chitinophagaceae bacterium]|nr:hypothetical protein [Chitinophagaceae bacterium]
MTKIINKKQKATNRHWKNFVDKDYLGSHNLESGEELLVTIERFMGEEPVKNADGKESLKTVLYFKEEVPKMIMNITNGNTISNLYGTHPDQWIGKQIQIYAAPVKAFGKTQDALRIRDFIPKINVDISTYESKMKTAKSLDELKTIWTSFPASARNTETLIIKKEEIKSTLQ